MEDQGSGGALRQDVRDRNQRPVGLLCEHEGTGAGESNHLYRQHEGRSTGKDGQGRREIVQEEGL